jgi:tRNA U34 2-thiouridine synthase MnmA/TrmU
MLKDRGQSTHGTKSELVMKLTLRKLNEDYIRAGKFQLSDMTVPELRELKTSLGVKGTAKNKSSLIDLLENCLQKA